MKKLSKHIQIFCFSALAIFTFGCDDYLDIPLPTNSIFAENAFSNDATTAATLNGVLATLSSDYYMSKFNLDAGLYVDEITLNDQNNLSAEQYYLQGLTPSNAPEYWSDFYPLIYRTNMIIEGITATDAILNNKDQYLGEAYFYRALFYFYLTNIYGDVALATSTDYTINNELSRVASDEVYAQILSDLELAFELLPENYRDQDGLESYQRDRPNRYAAKALMARVYLYTEQWTEAANAATELIDRSDLYDLSTIDQLFLTGNTNMIWNLMPDMGLYSFAPYVTDYYVFLGWYYGWDLESEFPYATGYISESLLSRFEEGDARMSTWLLQVDVSAGTFYFPYKYRSTFTGEEAQAFFRLGEQYLIRAEARAHTGELALAADDLNAIRNRAGLGNTEAETEGELLDAILKERCVEFFTECGHRFFDLKRTGNMDAVMSAEATVKGAGAAWEAYKEDWPISANEIYANPNLKQTTDY